MTSAAQFPCSISQRVGNQRLQTIVSIFSASPSARNSPPPRPTPLGRQRVQPLRQRGERGDRLVRPRFSSVQPLLQRLIIALQRLDVAFQGGHQRRVGRTYYGGLRRVRLIGQAYARTFVVPQGPRPFVADRPLSHRLDGDAQPCGSLGVAQPLPVHCETPKRKTSASVRRQG